MERRSFGTHDTARICQVTPPTIVRWMEEGNLPFFATLGGHRRIWDADLAAFLKARHMPLPGELERFGTKRVLIVDDEEAVRRVIRRALQKSIPGVEIREAADGFEAGRTIAEFPPSLVILDLKLPGLDGFKVCRRIRADRRLTGMKILAVSGHNVEESGKRSLEAGADDFLGKPFGTRELAEKAENLLSVPHRSKAGGAERGSGARWGARRREQLETGVR